MPFDIQTRNRLARFVTDARELLAAEFTQQLQSIYGITASGEVTPLSDLKHLDEQQRALAELLRDRLEYLKASSSNERNPATAALDRLTREQAFTVLNRLAALRMAEKRGFILESVGSGYQSKAFQIYNQVAGSALGDTYHRYRQYLFCLFDELAVDLGALFDRRSPAGLLFPREKALLAVFKLINAPETQYLWAEDETIGWIYQFYNDEGERRRMREQSSAPRDSRELAVRNQFFTPRYIVEFLVDNTLARTWYEMRKGKTTLKEICRYLVHQPSEIFLAEGCSVPISIASESVSSEELLKQTVYIPHRATKDPRDLKILDPACGSGHFLLYSFDLLEKIYEEAWKNELRAPSEVTGRSIRADFPSLHELQKAAPELIIHHNLHGIDIDLRACQIATVALWLRAQRSYQEQNLKQEERRNITKTNIVCAEPMPGDQILLEEFVVELQPKVLGQLVHIVFEKMKLAGEAGPLLKVESEISAAVGKAKQLWLDAPKTEQNRLFSEDTSPEQNRLKLDVSGITDESFWERAEDRIYAALRAYAEDAAIGHGYHRRLFSGDTARGFAFIDLCRKKYDVVLMNPPFGAAAKGTREYVAEHYPACSNDIFACFIDRGLNLACQGGSVGAITSRTGLFLETFTSWRKSAMFGSNSVFALLDLGYGVLDAMVETAAYVLERGRAPSRTVCVRGLRFTDKGEQALENISALQRGCWLPDVYVVDQRDFQQLPLCSFPYWLPKELLSIYFTKPSFVARGGSARKGLTTGDNFRFVRTTWEVPASQIVTSREATLVSGKWAFFPKGGEYSPFYDDVHLLVNWEYDGKQIRNFTDAESGRPFSRPQNTDVYFCPGLTYPYRTTSGFNLRPLQRGCIFSDGGQAVFFEGKDDSESGARDYLLAVLGYFNTRYARLFLEVALGEGDAVTSGSAARNYVTGAIEQVPMFTDKVDVRKIAQLVAECIHLQMANFAHDETSRTFVLPALNRFHKLADMAAKLKKEYLERCAGILERAAIAEHAFAKDFGLSQSGETILDQEFGKVPTTYANVRDCQSQVRALASLATEELIDEALRVVGPGRYVVKKMYLSERRLELISHLLKRSPQAILEDLAALRDDELVQFVSDILSWLFGCAFGRWDVRFATGEKQAADLPDPFAPLPICAPGMLQIETPLSGIAEQANRSQADGRGHYPLAIPQGILVDDPGSANDIVAKIRTVLILIWGTGAETIEEEACQVLGVKELREYFRKPTAFFLNHLQRYSKSRRQAPLYLPLSTRSGRYSLWLYYPVLTAQTLHQCIADFLIPKLKNISAEIQVLRSSDGSQVRLGELLDLQDELKDMQLEIERIIKLPYVPNLNDGVLISAAPLWNLFRMSKWQKDLKDCWDKLEAGDYDWANLALSIWPDRVKEKCKTDRSLAIAHSLENLYGLEEPKSRPMKRRVKQPSFLSEDAG